MLDTLAPAPYQFSPGHLPLLVSFPHNGSYIPESIIKTMTPEGRSSQDSDWWLSRLYDLPETQDASKLIANYSRYVIDLNRPTNGSSLYPGQATTGLVPKMCFSGSPIYLQNKFDDESIQPRIDSVWLPYHQKVVEELNRLKQKFGKIVLVDAHSIKSRVPQLFEGTLPDFNIGSNHHNSCSDELVGRVESVVRRFDDYTQITNGRFIGGFITRHYGDPENGIHAIQFELSQATYMDEQKSEWDEVKADRVQEVFRCIFREILDWVQSDG